MKKIMNINDLNYQDFKKFNMNIEKGKFYTITGGNNSGKTLLFNLICGIIPTNSNITCHKQILSRDNVNKYITNLGVVRPIDNNSFLFKMVKEELEYPLHNLNYSKQSSRRRIKKILKEFNLENIYQKNIDDLNNSTKQKLLFVLSLLHKPKVLLIDEAFNILDNNDKKFVINYLKKEVKKHQLTIINFTVDLNDALRSDCLYLLENNHIVTHGEPKNILINDQIFYKSGLEVPFMIDLSLKLKLYNLVDKVYYDMEELVNALWK